MKGAPGLILAVFLGVLGAALNWFYLERQTRDVASVSFLGIREGASIQPGQMMTGGQFAEVKIPERHARNLKDFVYLYEDLATLEGLPATRVYEGGELVFRQDYRTPPVELKLAANEELFWVPVDDRAFVPSLVNPGDHILFVLPAAPATDTASVVAADANPTADNSAASTLEQIGPFRVRSLGDRLGSVDVMKAARRSPTQERLIGIVIDKTKADEVERAARLQDRLRNGDYRNVSVKLLGRP